MYIISYFKRELYHTIGKLWASEVQDWIQAHKQRFVSIVYPQYNTRKTQHKKNHQNYLHNVSILAEQALNYTVYSVNSQLLALLKYWHK